MMVRGGDGSGMPASAVGGMARGGAPSLSLYIYLSILRNEQ